MMSSAVGAAAAIDRKRVGKNLDAIIHIKRNTHEPKRTETETSRDAKTQRVEGVCPAATAATRSEPPILHRSFESVSTPLILH